MTADQISDARASKPFDPSRRAAGAVERKSFSEWRNCLAGAFELGGAHADGVDPEMVFVARTTGRYMIGDTSAPPHRLSRATGAIAEGATEALGIRLQLSGAVLGEVGDRRVAIRAGDVFFFDLQQNFDLQITAGAEHARDICLWVPRSRILAAFGRDDVLHGLVLAGVSAAGAMIGGGLKILAEQAPKLSVAEMDALCEGLVALAANTLGPVLASPRGTVMSPAAAFVTIRRYIDRNLRSPHLDVDRLADIFGVSRASLYRLFEPVGGVASYIRKARLRLAYQEILGSEVSGRRIGPIAFSLGFKNVSAFNRAFRDQYGVSPREARARIEAPPVATPPNVAAEGVDPTQTLAYWLARLGGPAPADAKK